MRVVCHISEAESAAEPSGTVSDTMFIPVRKAAPYQRGFNEARSEIAALRAEIERLTRENETIIA
jgi:hypothetical protein